MQTYKSLIQLVKAQDKFGIDLFDTDNYRVNRDAVEVEHVYTGEYCTVSDALGAVIELHDSQGGCCKQ